jgi:chorismate mutase
LKKAALLPRDAARIINGLAHIPVDLMKAIAVLDAPASVKSLTRFMITILTSKVHPFSGV